VTNVRVWLRRFIGYLLVGAVTHLCTVLATLIARQFTHAAFFSPPLYLPGHRLVPASFDIERLAVQIFGTLDLD
jgi:hypothetical protein